MKTLNNFYIKIISKKKSAKYFIIFILSSFIFFSKGILLAYKMEPNKYGSYISIYAISIFIGSIMSFGLIEETTKKFPRYWVNNDRNSINIYFDNIKNNLYKRLIIFFPISFITTYFVFNKIDIITTLVALTTSFTSSYFSLYASLIRSTGNINKMSEIQLFRALISIIFVYFATYFNNWLIVFLFDAIASVISLFNCFFVKKNILTQNANNNLLKVEINETKKSNDGMLLYFSFLLTSLPGYFDKSIIGKTIGFSFAATYNVHLIIVQVSVLLCNIISQKVGPELIKLQIEHKKKSIVFKHLFKWVIIFFIVNILFVILFYLIVKLNIFPSFTLKYNINIYYLILCGAIALLQITSLIEFFMISYDLEKYILISSFIYIISIIVSFTICVFLKFTLIFYFAATLFSKSLQILYQIFVYNTFEIKIHKIYKT